MKGFYSISELVLHIHIFQKCEGSQNMSHDTHCVQLKANYRFGLQRSNCYAVEPCSPMRSLFLHHPLSALITWWPPSSQGVPAAKIFSACLMKQAAITHTLPHTVAGKGKIGVENGSDWEKNIKYIYISYTVCIKKGKKSKVHSWHMYLHMDIHTCCVATGSYALMNASINRADWTH